MEDVIVTFTWRTSPDMTHRVPKETQLQAQSRPGRMLNVTNVVYKFKNLPQ